jgi:hypothetical protein
LRYRSSFAGLLAQLAMDEVGIPFATQNRLLARLAPYERDVVTK